MPAALPIAVGRNVAVKLTDPPAGMLTGSAGSLDTVKTGVVEAGIWPMLMLLIDPAEVPVLVIWNVRTELCPTAVGGKITAALFSTVDVTLPAT